MHNLIIGQTGSGKTTLAKMICRELTNRGHSCLVLDKFRDNWQCHFLATDSEQFNDYAKRSINCFLFVDESWQHLDHYNKNNLWLATESRHWGHTAFFITQRAQLISVTARNQCSKLFLFNCSLDDSKILANEFNDKRLLEANYLLKGQYIYKKRFYNAEKRKVF